MACLKNNGIELARIEYAGSRISVRSNGRLLRDTGAGWKRWRRVPAGVTVQDWVADLQKRKTEVDAKGGPRAEFRNKIVELFPSIKQRARVYWSLKRCAATGVGAVLGDIFWDLPPRLTIEILVPLYLRAVACENNCKHEGRTTNED